VQCTNAQQLGVYLSASFDSPNGNAYAYAPTTLDYSASYYYFVCTSINALAEEDNGNQQGYESSEICDATDAQVSWSFSIPTDTDYMNFNGVHQEFIDYNTYQFDSNCGSDGYNCNDYWDYDEMSFLGIDGQTYNGPTYWYLPGPPPASISQNQLSQLTHQELGSYCFYPRFETSIYNGVEPVAQTGFYGGMFTGQLDTFNGFASYAGRTVGESVNTTSVDATQGGCYFFQSIFIQPSNTTFLDSSKWGPLSGTTYNFDDIGDRKDEADYYQGLVNTPPSPQNPLGLKASCTLYTSSQVMSISSCRSSTPISAYNAGNPNTLIFIINPGSMTAFRGSTSGPAQ
jgi:hypothetical protein